MQTRLVVTEVRSAECKCASARTFRLGSDILAVHLRLQLPPAHIDAILARLDRARLERGVLSLGEQHTAVGRTDNAAEAENRAEQSRAEQSRAEQSRAARQAEHQRAARQTEGRQIPLRHPNRVLKTEASKHTRINRESEACQRGGTARQACTAII